MPIARSQWVVDKTETALALYNGECGGSYNEAVIIISAVISSFAAEIWPGDRKDKNRFVEVIKNYCDPLFNPTLISVPLLIQDLEESSRADHAVLLRQKFLNYSEYQVLRARDTDRVETEILEVCPDMILKELRKYSYASVFYEEVRSCLVHEYKTSKKTDTWPVAATDEDEISYGNWSEDPRRKGPTIRRIHFPMQWLINVAKSVAENVDRNGYLFPLTEPRVWWLSGG